MARQKASIAFVGGFSRTVRPVVDRTGLKPEFDFILKYDRNTPPDAEKRSTEVSVVNALRVNLG